MSLGIPANPPNLLILANKRYHTDFRKYLMRACEAAGGRALHIYCWEQVVLSTAGSEDTFLPSDVDENVVLRHVRDRLGDDELIVLTGLGSVEASIATRLHRVLGNAHFVYDVYDDLTFNAGGFQLIHAMLQDAIWRCRCQHTILLDATLRHRYPRGHHLDNASHLHPIAAVRQADPRDVIYIGSIDDRVDFAWLEALASQDVRLAIHGRIHDSAEQARPNLDRLLSGHRNVTFHGSYDNDDLGSIFGSFRTGVLPYRADHPMTRHVNPDKLYHYLNAGMEVLAAPIPQARRHADHLHLITTDGDWRQTLDATINAPRQGRWSAADNSWPRRWSALVAFLMPEAAMDREHQH